MMIIPLFIGFYTSQVVQDFRHQQYLSSAGNRPVIKTPTAQAVKEKDGVFTASCQDGDAAPIFDLDAHDEVTAGFLLGSIPRA